MILSDIMVSPTLSKYKVMPLHIPIQFNSSHHSVITLSAHTCIAQELCVRSVCECLLKLAAFSVCVCVCVSVCACMRATSLCPSFCVCVCVRVRARGCVRACAPVQVCLMNVSIMLVHLQPGVWVLRTACARTVSWAGLAKRQRGVIKANLSAVNG